MDFGVAALGQSRENGLGDLGARLAASGSLMAVGGQTGGAWASKASIFDIAYDTYAKYAFRDPPDAAYSAAAASDEMVCFAVQNRVRCHWLSQQQDEDGNFWRDIFNLQLPPKWADLWGRRNFLINTHLHEKVWQLRHAAQASLRSPWGAHECNASDCARARPKRMRSRSSGRDRQTDRRQRSSACALTQLAPCMALLCLPPNPPGGVPQSLRRLLHAHARHYLRRRGWRKQTLLRHCTGESRHARCHIWKEAPIQEHCYR